MSLICLCQDSLQRSLEPNSDSIHLDFTMIRFISDSIQHRPDSIQTQFTSASPVLDSTQNSQKIFNCLQLYFLEGELSWSYPFMIKGHITPIN